RRFVLYRGYIRERPDAWPGHSGFAILRCWKADGLPPVARERGLLQPATGARTYALDVVLGSAARPLRHSPGCFAPDGAVSPGAHMERPSAVALFCVSPVFAGDESRDAHHVRVDYREPGECRGQLDSRLRAFRRTCYGRGRLG